MAQGTMMDTQEGLTKLVEAGANEELAKVVVELLAGAQITDSMTKTELNDCCKDLSARVDTVEEDAEDIVNRKSIFKSIKLPGYVIGLPAALMSYWSFFTTVLSVHGHWCC